LGGSVGKPYSSEPSALSGKLFLCSVRWVDEFDTALIATHPGITGGHYGTAYAVFIARDKPRKAMEASPKNPTRRVSRPRWAATLLAFPFLLCVAPSARAIVYSLGTDWRDDPGGNPNGVWSVRSGTNLLPWTAASAFGNPGWSGPTGAPQWFKSEINYFDLHIGDIVTHSSSNNATEGIGNILWTAPQAGTIDISGAAWFGAEDGAQNGRSSVWKLWFNGNLLSSGEVAFGDIYDRSSPFLFSLGSGGAGVLQNIPVNVGDELMLEVVKETGAFGTFVGVDLSVDLATPTVGVPESGASAGLLLIGILPLAVFAAGRRVRRRHA
jgi:hypothetical protein